MFYSHICWRTLNYIKQMIEVSSCLFLFREQIECKLTFLGLLVLENQLKVETEPVIRSLHAAKIRTIMVTGMTCVVSLLWVTMLECFWLSHRTLHQCVVVVVVVVVFNCCWVGINQWMFVVIKIGGVLNNRLQSVLADFSAPIIGQSVIRTLLFEIHIVVVFIACWS